MRFTLVILAGALLLTNSIESNPTISALQDFDGDSWMFKSNVPQVNPYTGTACGTLNGCPRGLTCYYEPSALGSFVFNPPTLCYPTAALGRPCNDATGPDFVLCGEAQECAPIVPGSTTTVCRKVATIALDCQVGGEPMKNWCDDGQVCAQPTGALHATCLYPKYNGDSCNPLGAPAITTYCMGGGTCSTTTTGELGYGYCTGGSNRPFA